MDGEHHRRPLEWPKVKMTPAGARREAIGATCCAVWTYACIWPRGRPEAGAFSRHQEEEGVGVVHRGFVSITEPPFPVPNQELITNVSHPETDGPRPGGEGCRLLDM